MLWLNNEASSYSWQRPRHPEVHLCGCVNQPELNSVFNVSFHPQFTLRARSRDTIGSLDLNQTYFLFLIWGEWKEQDICILSNEKNRISTERDDTIVHCVRLFVTALSLPGNPMCIPEGIVMRRHVSKITFTRERFPHPQPSFASVSLNLILWATVAIKCSSKHHADILNIKYKHLPSKIFPRRMFGTKVVRDKSQITIRHITQDGWGWSSSSWADQQ